MDVNTGTWKFLIAAWRHDYMTTNCAHNKHTHTTHTHTHTK